MRRDHSFPPQSCIDASRKEQRATVCRLCARCFELAKRKSSVFEYLQIASVQALVMGKSLISSRVAY
jgi:hypothetical protein